MIVNRCLCWILAFLLTAASVFSQPSQVPAAPQAVPSRLGITVLEGENAVNSISLGSSVTPVIEVHDSNDFPLEGAIVVFALPANGPGGSFPGNQTSYTTRSDSRGQAT